MMSELNVIHGLIAFLGVVAVIWFFYGPWQHLVIDLIRQQLFEIRDGAFDGARRGEYRFDSIQYVIFRDYTNSMIRGAGHATIWRFAINFILRRKIKNLSSYLTNYLSGDQSIEPLKARFNKACAWITLLLWIRSPFLITISFFIAAVSPFVALLAIISSRVRKFPRLFEAAIKSQIQRDVVIDIGNNEGCA